MSDNKTDTHIIIKTGNKSSSEPINKTIITKPLLNYEDKYLITSEGNIINKITNEPLSKQLKYKDTSYEYYVVALNYDKKIKKVPIHKLMAENFELTGEGNNIIHIDGNNKNNNLENLKYSTSKNRINKQIPQSIVYDTSSFRDIGMIHNVFYKYKINIDGVIINKANKILNPIKSPEGVDYIRLSNNNKSITCCVDRLVGKVFLENGDKYFEDPNYILKYNMIGDRKNYYWTKK